ncbi:MAG: hypothetical protein PHS56_08020 [Eubacteriales bacterium]|nr:hypothetical protein [Eubacteriales bacterium]
MKKFLTVFLIVILVLGLLIGGLVFALSPPFPVVAPQQSEFAELKPALNAYLMERAALALDDYSGEGDIEISLDEAGLSQVLADALASQIDNFPRRLKYTGVFIDIRQEYIQVGASFKFLIFPIGVSARMQAEIRDGNLILKVNSAHLGRIPLPLNFVLKTAGKYTELPEEISSLSFSVPLNDKGESMGINISGLKLQAEQMVFSVLASDNLFPELDEAVLQDLEELKPQAQSILADNPEAMEILDELEALLEESKTTGKQVNPLRLSVLGEELYSSLSEVEIQELRNIVDDETMEFLEQNMDWF